MTKISIKSLLIFSLLIFSPTIFNNCDKEPVGPDNNGISENITRLIGSKDKFYGGSSFMGVWYNNQIFSTGPVQEWQLDNHHDVIRDSILILLRFYSYISCDENGSKLLLVRTNYGDASAGGLLEYDLKSGHLELLIDSTLHVSSAVYWHGDDSKIVYYRYGNPVGTDPGYYLFDKISGKDSLLFSYISPVGPSEMLNGFDLHPNNNKLLIPAIQATPLTSRPPKLFEYDLETGLKDTLNVSFSDSPFNIGLWLRYNNDGSQILYCNFPSGAYTYTTNSNSEVGIITRSSLQKRVLDVNTNPNGRKESVQLAPNWSPDNKHIVYGSGRLSREDARGLYYLYILKNVN